MTRPARTVNRTASRTSTMATENLLGDVSLKLDMLGLFFLGEMAGMDPAAKRNAQNIIDNEFTPN